MTPAEKLAGLSLDGEWSVAERLDHADTTGGFFSVPYLVHDRSGKPHFLKAFDFSSAFEPRKDVIKTLQAMTAWYEHERDILEHCKSRRLSGVVIAITHGYVLVPGLSAQEGTVYYLIFELAEGDIRRQVDLQKRMDCVWSLKVLDDITLGLWQVHRESIAHQDLKPSNVLHYREGNSRIADFGRASRKGRPIWTDELTVAGDQTYAPPELLYSYTHPDFVPRRIGCDLYLLGNIASFMFSGINVTAAIFSRLDPQFHPDRWGGKYDQVLPHIQCAFEDIIIDLAQQIDPIVRDDLVQIIRELCAPDISRRGHPKGIGRHDQYSLERYKSRFDLLLKRAAIKARLRKSA